MSTQWNRIAERIVGDVVILDVSGGPISFSDDSGRLYHEIQRCLSQGWRKILLNLADVEYVDSAGLSEIARGYRDATGAGGLLKLCCVVRRIRHVLIVTKLDRHIDVFDAERAALDSFETRRDGRA